MNAKKTMQHESFYVDTLRLYTIFFHGETFDYIWTKRNKGKNGKTEWNKFWSIEENLVLLENTSNLKLSFKLKKT